jgi:signal transduction histidine kinase
VRALLAAAGHDFSSTLARLVVRAGVLRDEILANPSAPPTDLVLDGLAHIEATAETMRVQLAHLLDLASLEPRAPPLRLVRSPTDLLWLVCRIADDFQLTTRRHRLRVEQRAAQVFGYWDPSLLERVFANLIGNAVKFSPGGGEIRVSVEREVDALGAWALVHVQDQGLGVPAADLGDIFKPFVRASNVRDIEGAGIGLASAWVIVVQHGGTISAVSQEGTGSTFTVRLPLGPAEDRS